MIAELFHLPSQFELRQDQRVLSLDIRQCNDIDSSLLLAELILRDASSDSTALCKLQIISQRPTRTLVKLTRDGLDEADKAIQAFFVSTKDNALMAAR